MDALNKEAWKERLKLFSVEEVLEMWPITREYLSRLTHHRDESKRVPCRMFGRRPMYAPEELQWYSDNHKFSPKKRRGKK